MRVREVTLASKHGLFHTGNVLATGCGAGCAELHVGAHALPGVHGALHGGLLGFSTALQVHVVLTAEFGLLCQVGLPLLEGSDASLLSLLSELHFVLLNLVGFGLTRLRPLFRGSHQCELLLVVIVLVGRRLGAHWAESGLGTSEIAKCFALRLHLDSLTLHLDSFRLHRGGSGIRPSEEIFSWLLGSSFSLRFLLFVNLLGSLSACSDGSRRHVVMLSARFRSFVTQIATVSPRVLKNSLGCFSLALDLAEVNSPFLWRHSREVTFTTLGKVKDELPLVDHGVEASRLNVFAELRVADVEGGKLQVV